MNPLVEELIHGRIDADLKHKSLTMSGNIDADNPDSGLSYVTIQAAEELRKMLRPYVEYVNSKNTPGQASLEQLAEKYLEIFGENNG